MSIGILIIDEHEAVRNRLARRLAGLPDLDIVGSSGDAEEALCLLCRLAPDVVLIDVKMTRYDGVELCRRVTTQNPSAKLMVLTSYDDLSERRRVMEAGAREYFLKNVDTPTLAGKIRELAQFGPAFC